MQPTMCDFDYVMNYVDPHQCRVGNLNFRQISPGMLRVIFDSIIKETNGFVT